MLVLDGKAVAADRRAALKDSIKDFVRATGKVPGLAVILVGQDPASEVYVRNKGMACESVGIKSFEFKLNEATPSEELKKLIVQLNNRNDVHGILVQLPLPKHLDSDEILSWVDPRKDPDCLTTENLGLLLSGKPRVLPCTPNGVMAILDHYDIPLAGKTAVVVGRSNIVGKPMALLLQTADATVTVCHSKTQSISEHTKLADVVVVAAGKQGLLGRDDFKEGSVVVDVGMHRDMNAEGKVKLSGDVRYAELKGWSSAATPVPGGVGPMTITMLLENTLSLAQQTL